MNILAKATSIFRSFLPKERPKIDIGALYRIAQQENVNLENQVCLIGVRGFYNKGQNQRAIYDDAIFILSPRGEVGFNANTDPGAFKEKIANLKVGTWLYKLGIHGYSKPEKDRYEALVQAANVTVIRDKRGEDTGKFGINIHRGGWNKVSSLGCQTIYPKQWDEFIKTVKQELRFHKQETLKYILRDMKDE